MKFDNFTEPFSPIDFKDVPLTEKEYLTLAAGIEPFDGKFSSVGVDGWIYIYYRGGRWANKIKLKLGADELYHITEYYATPHFGNLLLETMYDSYDSPYLRNIAIREFHNAPKIIYHPEEIGDENSRFALYQTGGKRNLFVIGLNPSTANKEHGDPTMKKVLGFARHNGYDGYVMMNVYPQRATNPDDLHQTCDVALHQKNLSVIQHLLGDETGLEFLFAFGDNIAKRDYLLSCLKDIIDVIEPHIGIIKKYATMQIGEPTKKGFPRHPLYEKYDAFCYFDIKTFLREHGL